MAAQRQIDDRSPGGRFLVSDQVFERLLTSILGGDYKPGEKLPTQRTLAADLEVTMTSLREALKRLEQMGLVEVRHGDAMRVRDWQQHGGLDVIAHLLFRSGTLDWGVLNDIFEARGLVLRELATLAAQQRRPEHAERLAELADSYASAADSTVAQEIDFAFFTELAQAAGNIVFILIMNSIRSLYFQYAALLPLAERSDQLKDYYRQIADAVAVGSAEQASQAATELAALQWQRVEAMMRASGQ